MIQSSRILLREEAGDRAIVAVAARDTARVEPNPADEEAETRGMAEATAGTRSKFISCTIDPKIVKMLQSLWMR